MFGSVQPENDASVQLYLSESGRQYSIVHSLDGYDEVSLTDTFKVQSNMGEYVYTPEKIGFKRLAQEELWGGNRWTMPLKSL